MLVRRVVLRCFIYTGLLPQLDRLHLMSFNVVSPDFHFRISASVVWMGFNMYFCRYVFTFQP